MTMLSAIRDRFSGHNTLDVDPPKPPGDTPAGSAEEARLPFAGYDRLDDKRVVEGLSDHSQVELEAVEGYERSHQDRERVLDKLRFMRQPEPLPGYDALGVEEILAALKDADLATIKKIRGYERKFAGRSAVLEEVARVHDQRRTQRRATEPASPAPSYQPMSGTSVASDRPEKTGRP